MTSASIEQFRLAMRRMAASVYIVAGQHEGKRAGMTATSVTSVSFDPLSILVCIHHSASCHDVIAAAGRFSLSLLGPDHREIAGVFSRPATEEERFGMGQWFDLGGAPALEGATAALLIETTAQHAIGTHTVFIGDVSSVVLGETGEALQYGQGQFGRFVPS